MTTKRSERTVCKTQAELLRIVSLLRAIEHGIQVEIPVDDVQDAIASLTLMTSWPKGIETTAMFDSPLKGDTGSLTTAQEVTRMIDKAYDYEKDELCDIVTHTIVALLEIPGIKEAMITHAVLNDDGQAMCHDADTLYEGVYNFYWEHLANNQNERSAELRAYADL